MLSGCSKKTTLRLLGHDILKTGATKKEWVAMEKSKDPS